MSGLILLVIVGAWLAVLVPMALRSHDAGRSLATVDSFRDAMRVLARRDPLPSEVAAPAARPRPAVDGERLLFDDLAGSDGVVAPRRRPAEPARSAAAARPATDRRHVGPATVAGRRQVLLGLVATALVLLVGGLLGPGLLLVGHVLADLLVVAYLGHLRHQTVLRREQDRRSARRAAPARRAAAGTPGIEDAVPGTVRTTPYGAARPVAEQARVLTRGAGSRAQVRLDVPARVAGIPDRMPARVGPLEVVVARESAEQLPPPVRGAQGEPWQPVPVPLPGYVTAATAPRRVLDLTRPGEWSDGVAAGEREPGADGQGPEPDEILERRRASGGW